MRYAPLSMNRAQQGSPLALTSVQQPGGMFDPTKPARTAVVSDAQRAWEREAGALNSWLGKNLYSIEQPEWNMDGGNAPPPVANTWALDPWTNRLVRTSAGVDVRTEYGPMDSERQVFTPRDPDVARTTKRGGFTPESFADLETVRSQLSPEKRAEFDALYAKTQEAYKPFSEQYLPATLRSQVAQFIPEDTSKMGGFIKNRDYGINRITSSLAERGVTDLSKLGLARDAQGNPVIYDPRTGEAIDTGLVTFKGGSGDGNLTYLLQPNAQGTGLTIGTKFKKPEKQFVDYVGDAIPAIILGSLAGPMGATLGTAMGGSAGAMLGGKIAAGALTGAAGAGMQGGDPLRGALTGGFSAGLGGMGNLGSKVLGSTAPAWQQAAINRGVQGALGGGLNAALGGGNVGQGFLTGGLGSAIGGGLSAYGNSLFQGQNPLMQGVGRVGTGALSGGVQGLLRGQGFEQGARQGALGGLQGVAGGVLSGQAQRMGLPPDIARMLGGYGGRMLTAPLARGLRL